MKPPRKLHIKSYGCQMNVYDAQRMVDTLARRRLCRDGQRRGCRSGDPQHLPYPRKGLREGLLRARAAARRQGRGRTQRPRDADCGRGLRRAGRGRGNHPPRADRGRRRWAAKLSSSAAASGARKEPWPRAGDRIPGRGQVRFPPRPQTGCDPRPRNLRVRHGAGRLRQVLHLLRGALYARLGSIAPGRKDRRRREAAR